MDIILATFEKDNDPDGVIWEERLTIVVNDYATVGGDMGKRPLSDRRNEDSVVGDRL